MGKGKKPVNAIKGEQGFQRTGRTDPGRDGIATPPTVTRVEPTTPEPVAGTGAVWETYQDRLVQAREDLYSKVAADLQLAPEDVRALVKTWAEEPDRYEDPVVPDAYDYSGLAGNDPAMKRALCKLGYTHYLEQPLPVFVYGTLRTGQGNSRLIDPARQDTRMAVADGIAVYHSSYGFPYAAEHEDDSVTVGELVWLSDTESGEIARYNLDYLEGFDCDFPSRSHYERVARNVRYTDDMGEEKNTQAWVYLARSNKPHLIESDRIPHGDWVQSRKPHDFSRHLSRF